MLGGFDTDTFVFGGAIGSDTISDFIVGQDVLALNQNLWAGNLNATQVLDQFGAVAGANYVLDFGDGNQITFAGGIDEALLLDDILLF